MVTERTKWIGASVSQATIDARVLLDFSSWDGGRMFSGTGKASERFTVKRFNLAPRSDLNRFELQLKSSPPCSHQPPSVHPITRNPIPGPERRNGCRSTTKSSLPSARVKFNRNNLSNFPVSTLPTSNLEEMHNVDLRRISPAGIETEAYGFSDPDPEVASPPRL